MTSAPTLTLTPNNMYLGQTDTEPRPTALTWPWDHLAERQRLWDEALRWRRENDRLRTERLAALEAKKRAEVDRAAAADDARAHARQADIAADLRTRFLGAGGTAAQWEQARDELVLEAIKAATLGRPRDAGAGAGAF